MRKTPKNAISKQARRAAIAKGLIQQKTPAQLAKQLGVSRETVYQEMRNPETKNLIRSWMAPYHAEIQRMIPDALVAVSDGLDSSQDIKDRLAAVKTLGVLMEWCEGQADGDSDGVQHRKWSGEFIELLAMYAEIKRRPTPDAVM
jgi:hypothetical protein